MLLPAVGVWDRFRLLFQLKELVAVFQSFHSQGILVRRTVRHGFDPFASVIGPSACTDGFSQDIVVAVGIRDHHASVASQPFLSAGTHVDLLVSETVNLSLSPFEGGVSPNVGFRRDIPTRFYVYL